MEEISSKLRGTAKKYSSSSSISNPDSDSNLRSSFIDSNSDSNSNFNSYSNSDQQSSWGTKGEATLPCHGRSPFTNSHIETKFDITNKISNGC